MNAPDRSGTITFDLDDAADARTYIATWGPRLLGRKVTFVKTNTRTIQFATMSDDDAKFVAQHLWQMEQKALAK